MYFYWSGMKNHKINLILFKKKWFVSFVLGVLVLSSILSVALYLNKMRADTYGASLVTKRFGDCPSCDIKTTDQANPVMASATIGPYGAYTDSVSLEAFRGDQNYWYLSKYNLTSIPTNTVIRSAKLRLFTTSNNLGSNAGVSVPIYSFTGSDVGAWNAQGLSYNYKDTTNNTKWTNCGSGTCDFSTIFNTFSDQDKIGSFYFKGTPSGYNQLNNYYEADLTDAVQGWVTNPLDNLGFAMKADTVINGWIAGRNYGISDSNEPQYLRPYLEITYEGVNDEEIAQAANISATYHSGQTFITWDEANTGKDETSYKIYRSTSGPISSNNLDGATLIGQVYQGSSFVGDYRSNYSAQTGFYQPKLYANSGSFNVPLNHYATDGSGVESGLYVYTDRETSNNVYYAVTTVVEGNENRSVGGSNSNSLTNPVSETQASINNQPDYFYYTTGVNSASYSKYVMWLDDYNPKDSNDEYGFSNHGSTPFIFSFVLPQKEVPSNNYALLTESDRVNRTPLNGTTKYPLSVYLHPSGHTSDDSTEASANSLCTNLYLQNNCSTDYVGGFTVSFEDLQPMFLRNAQKQMSPLGRTPTTNFIETAEGWDYYLGYNSNYAPTTIGTNGVIKSFFAPKPFENGKSILYTQKAMRFIIENLQDKSTFAKNIDKQRLYMTGGSLGGGGSLFFAIHNPGLVTAIDVVVARSWARGINDNRSGEFDLTCWGTPGQNISTQPGVGDSDGVPIYDYLNMNEYIKSHKTTDFPLIRMTNGKLDTNITWSNQTPVFYQAANEAKLSITAYFLYADHSFKYPAGSPNPADIDNPFYSSTPEWHGNPNLVYYINPSASYPNDPGWWNYFKYRNDQSYPAFSNFSNNSNPGTGDPNNGDARGAINRYETWNNTNIVDQSDHYSIDLKLYSPLSQTQTNYPGGSTTYQRDINSIETADVTLRRLQSLIHTTGTSFHWTNVGDGVNQSGDITINSESEGLLTIPNLDISKAGTTLTLDRLESDQPPVISDISDFHGYSNRNVSITASVIDGTTYSWSKISGPGNVTFASSTSLSTTVACDQVGTYIVELAATNSHGTSTKRANIKIHKDGDINGDGYVNITDFASLLANWGTPNNKMADLNGNNSVDIFDFAVLLSKWGS